MSIRSGWLVTSSTSAPRCGTIAGEWFACVVSGGMANRGVARIELSRLLGAYRRCLTASAWYIQVLVGRACPALKRTGYLTTAAEATF